MNFTLPELELLLEALDKIYCYDDDKEDTKKNAITKLNYAILEKQEGN